MDSKRHIPSFLTCLTESIPVTIHRAFGISSNYSYQFLSSEESTGKYNVICTITSNKQKVSNSFRLVVEKPGLWILVCDKISNKTISPVITMPIEYKPKINSWVMTGTFDAVRALFTLNTFQDGFGLLSSLMCSYATVQFHCATKFMVISCYSLGGFCLNQAKLDERSHFEEDANASLVESPKIESVYRVPKLIEKLTKDDDSSFISSALVKLIQHTKSS